MKKYCITYITDLNEKEIYDYADTETEVKEKEI